MMAECGWGQAILRPEVSWRPSFQVNHLRCLHEFVKSQTTYYAQCYRHMLDLQKQLGRCGWTQVSEAPYLPDPVSGPMLLAKGLLF